MQNFRLVWLAFGLLSGVLKAAEPSLLMPLAQTIAPPCSKHSGVRSTRSDVVALAQVTASISAQATREGESCIQSAALWVTQKGVSQQFELPDAGAKNLAIWDVAPDASAVLLSSYQPGADDSWQLAVVPLADGTVKWTPPGELLGFHNCGAELQPQGFLDPRHIVIAASPQKFAHALPDCVTKATLFSAETDRHQAKIIAPATISRLAAAISGSFQSCQSDPDVVGACYRTRARLALTKDGNGMTLWPVGSGHFLSVQEDMVPEELRAQVSADQRIYATMLICPISPERSGPHRICIDSATDLKPDPINSRNLRSASTRHPIIVTAESH